MLKVLWIASWFPSTTSPFNGDFIERMGKAVAPFCEIMVLHAGEGPVEEMEIRTEKDVYPRVLVTVPFSPKANYLRRYWKLRQGVKAGLKIVRKDFGQPDLIHLQVMFPLGIFCVLDAYLRKHPLVVTEHWTGYRKINWKELGIIKWNSLLVSKKAKCILPVSKQLALDMQELGMKSRFEIIPNVVDSQLFFPADKPETQGTIFLHVSTLNDKAKNVTGIFEGFSAVSQKHPATVLKLIGDGRDRAAHETLVEALQMKDKIIFLGEMPHTSVAEEMRKADCLVHFSNYENLPCVILEAMASRLPVIATETGGMAEWVTEDTGILLKPGDHHGLVQAMEKMIESKHAYDSARIRNSVMGRCSPDVVGKQIIEVYKKILSNSGH